MKFKTRASDLISALEVVSVITPKVSGSEDKWLLFKIKDSRCYVYAADTTHIVRADFEVFDADTEGSFVVPYEKAKAIKYLDGTLKIEASSDPASGRYWVKYDTEDGGNGDWATANPALVAISDDRLDGAGTEFEFPAGLLKEALSNCSSTLNTVTDQDPDYLRTVQIFDDSKEEWAKGNGTMFSSNGSQLRYFYSEAFKGKGFSIHYQHLRLLPSFLAKSEGSVTIRVGVGSTCAVNSQGHVLSWTHHTKTHEKYRYFSLDSDQYVLKAPKDLLLKALRSVKSALGEKRDRIRVQYSASEQSLRFFASDGSNKTNSVPVGVKPEIEEGGAGALGGEKDIAFNASVDNIIDLVKDARGFEVQLRFGVVKIPSSGKEATLVRSVEDFIMTASGNVAISQGEAKEECYQCRVTRYTPSKE